MRDKLMKWVEKSVKSLLRRNSIDYLPRLVKADFLGRQYVVRNGAIKDCVDYDSAWILALAHNAQNIFDVGSNIGQSAFSMLQAPNVENVVLVDPAPLALTIAADTLIRNQMGHRVRFINAFVSDKSGETVQFTTTYGYGPGGHVVKHTDENKEMTIKIATISVDDIVEKVGINPDFIKFDVEGYEGQVLIGSTRLASRKGTRFMIEMHSKNRPQQETTQEVLDWCKKTNYAAWYLKEAVKITSPDPVKHRGRYHLLLQPETWDYPEWLAKIPQKAPVEAALDALKSSTNNQ
jgi:FkbM family methyltransferase